MIEGADVVLIGQSNCSLTSYIVFDVVLMWCQNEISYMGVLILATQKMPHGK